jgi:hypothetical protein
MHCRAAITAARLRPPASILCEWCQSLDSRTAVCHATVGSHGAPLPRAGVAAHLQRRLVRGLLRRTGIDALRACPGAVRRRCDRRREAGRGGERRERVGGRGGFVLPSARQLPAGMGPESKRPASKSCRVEAKHTAHGTHSLPCARPAKYHCGSARRTSLPEPQHAVQS